MILIIVTAEYTINSGFISSFIKSPSSSQTLSTSTQDFRPQHFEDKDCVDSRVFQFLPNMPQDFSKVVNSLNLNLPENFSKTFVDESYYKQPEFYSDFNSGCLSLYLALKPGAKFDYLGVSGFGIFPSSTNLKIERGTTGRAISFWHASCGVLNYQGIDFQISSDEKIQVKINPDYLLLGPTFPSYSNNWTNKVEAEISVPSDISPGNYKIEISPTQLPPEIDNNLRSTFINYASFANSIISSQQVRWEISLEVT